MLQQRVHPGVSTTFSESLENVCKLHCINGFQESYASVATTLSERYGNVAYLTLLQRNPGTLLKC